MRAWTKLRSFLSLVLAGGLVAPLGGIGAGVRTGVVFGGGKGFLAPKSFADSPKAARARLLAVVVTKLQSSDDTAFVGEDASVERAREFWKQILIKPTDRKHPKTALIVLGDSAPKMACLVQADGSEEPFSKEKEPAKFSRLEKFLAEKKEWKEGEVFPLKVLDSPTPISSDLDAESGDVKGAINFEYDETSDAAQLGAILKAVVEEQIALDGGLAQVDRQDLRGWLKKAIRASAYFKKSKLTEPDLDPLLTQLSKIVPDLKIAGIPVFPPLTEFSPPLVEFSI